jgi:hypothetical protein
MTVLKATKVNYNIESKKKNKKKKNPRRQISLLPETEASDAKNMIFGT